MSCDSIVEPEGGYGPAAPPEEILLILQFCNTKYQVDIVVSYHVTILTLPDLYR